MKPKYIFPLTELQELQENKNIFENIFFWAFYWVSDAYIVFFGGLEHAEPEKNYFRFFYLILKRFYLSKRSYMYIYTPIMILFSIKMG